MGNVESCCAYGASPRHDRTPKLKPGGAYRGTSSRANGHYHQQLRNEYDGISPDPTGPDRGFPGSGGGRSGIGGPPRSEESVGNLQHISEREPDDWEEDPSLHPTRETLFMEKTKKSIQNGLVRKRSQMQLASSRSSGELRVIKKSSSCSTIYTDDSTVSQPNLKNTIKVVSLAIYYHIKNRTSNQVLEIFDEKLHPLTRDGVPSDYCRYNPEHRQIYKFIRTLFNAAQLTAECAIVTLVYIERLIKYAEVDIAPGSWKRITLMSILLASKVWDDQAVWNVDYCQILKDLTVEDVNELEREFLHLLQFNTNVPQSVFVKYYFDLRTLAEANDLSYPPEPLTRDRALKLEAMSQSYDDKVTLEVIQSSVRKWASVDKLFVNRRNPLILS